VSALFSKAISTFSRPLDPFQPASRRQVDAVAFETFVNGFVVVCSTCLLRMLPRASLCRIKRANVFTALELALAKLGKRSWRWNAARCHTESRPHLRRATDARSRGQLKQQLPAQGTGLSSGYTILVLNPAWQPSLATYSYSTGFSAAELTMLSKYPEACRVVLDYSASRPLLNASRMGSETPQVWARPQGKFAVNAWAADGGLWTTKVETLISDYVRALVIAWLHNTVGQVITL
jgi:hypothetical protein